MEIPSRKKSFHSAASSGGSFSATSAEGDEKNRLRVTTRAAVWQTKSCTQGFHRLRTFSLVTCEGDKSASEFRRRDDGVKPDSEEQDQTSSQANMEQSRKSQWLLARTVG